MSIFECSGCGCIENTALCNYWVRGTHGKEPRDLCSECDPDIKEWHGKFKKQKVSDTDLQKAKSGFLYHPGDRMLIDNTKEKE